MNYSQRQRRSDDMNNNNILSEKYEKLSVFDEKSKKEIAVITADMITTANENIVVKLSPKA